MATTSLWKVEARLDKVLKYISNIEKIKIKTIQMIYIKVYTIR